MKNGWHALLRRAGAAEVALLAVAAIGLRDLEAAALTVGGLVALGLLRFRSGLFGRLGLGLLSADVAAWMATGAVSNLTHGEGFWETALPVALTVTAVTTLVAAAAAITHRSAGSAVRIVAGIAVAALVLGVGAAAIGVGTKPTLRSGDLSVITEDVRFSDETLEAEAGRIGIAVSNLDLFWHTLTIKELDVNVNVPVGAERRVEFEASPGTYEVICAIPGHVQAGMKGTLEVR